MGKIRSRAPLTLSLIIVGMFSAASHAGDNWPHWRGPQNNGLSGETGLPAEFGPERNVAWKVTLPGWAGSTPVAWDDRLFLTSAAADKDELLLLCFNTKGERLWSASLGRGNKVTGPSKEEGNSASPSPSTDGTHVWAMAGNGTLACFDFDGNEVWRHDLQDKYGKFNIGWGMTSSPVLDGDKLYIQLMHGPMRGDGKTAVVAALNKQTGEELWRIDRESEATFENKHSYTSPVVYRDGEHECLLTHGADYLVAHSLEDGRELWRLGGLNAGARYHPTLRFVASPTVAEGLIVVPTAKGGPMVTVKPGGQGNITNTDFVVWKNEQGTPDVSCPLVHDGLVYLAGEQGILTCLDAKTGEEYYKQRLHGARYRASPVYADGKIYIVARDGVITVVKPGKSFEMLAENAMGEEISASPVIFGGRIYLRSFDSLFSIEASK
ncbi:MAG: PQQ-binding-like beta-propeller repeat protein [Pirellulales bacterium]|nr:PQQ-binding-like beta-propeller repeat protein [Pirellulales bacterium]